MLTSDADPSHRCEQVPHLLFLHPAAAAIVGIIHIIPAEGTGADGGAYTAAPCCCDASYPTESPPACRVSDWQAQHKLQMIWLVPPLGLQMWCVAPNLAITAWRTCSNTIICELCWLAQVTCLFYLIDAATNDVVEGGKVDQQRPPWLGV